MEDLRTIVANHLEWVIMWETPGGSKKPVAAFLVRSDAELFLKHSDFKERMELIHNED